MIKNPPNGFENIIKEHFKFKKNDIIKKIIKEINEAELFKDEFEEIYKNINEYFE